MSIEKTSGLNSINTRQEINKIKEEAVEQEKISKSEAQNSSAQNKINYTPEEIKKLNEYGSGEKAVLKVNNKTAQKAGTISFDLEHEMNKASVAYHSTLADLYSKLIKCENEEQRKAINAEIAQKEAEFQAVKDNYEAIIKAQSSFKDTVSKFTETLSDNITEPETPSVSEQNESASYLSESTSELQAETVEDIKTNNEKLNESLNNLMGVLTDADAEKNQNLSRSYLSNYYSAHNSVMDSLIQQYENASTPEEKENLKLRMQIEYSDYAANLITYRQSYSYNKSLDNLADLYKQLSNAQTSDQRNEINEQIRALENDAREYMYKLNESIFKAKIDNNLAYQLLEYNEAKTPEEKAEAESNIQIIERYKNLYTEHLKGIENYNKIYYELTSEDTSKNQLLNKGYFSTYFSSHNSVIDSLTNQLKNAETKLERENLLTRLESEARVFNNDMNKFYSEKFGAAIEETQTPSVSDSVSNADNNTSFTEISKSFFDELKEALEEVKEKYPDASEFEYTGDAFRAVESKYIGAMGKIAEEAYKNIDAELSKSKLEDSIKSEMLRLYKGLASSTNDEERKATITQIYSFQVAGNFNEYELDISNKILMYANMYSQYKEIEGFSFNQTEEMITDTDGLLWNLNNYKIYDRLEKINNFKLDEMKEKAESFYNIQKNLLFELRSKVNSSNNVVIYDKDEEKRLLDMADELRNAIKSADSDEEKDGLVDKLEDYIKEYKSFIDIQKNKYLYDLDDNVRQLYIKYLKSNNKEEQQDILNRLSNFLENELRKFDDDNIATVTDTEQQKQVLYGKLETLTENYQRRRRSMTKRITRAESNEDRMKIRKEINKLQKYYTEDYNDILEQINNL